MVSENSFFSTLILLGAIQGFIIAGMLFHSTKKYRQNMLLALIMTLLAMAGTNTYLLLQNLNPFWQKLGDVLPLIIFMPIGPLLWLYIRWSMKNIKPSRKSLSHFLPVVLDVVPHILGFCYHLGLMGKNTPAIIEQYNVYVDLPRWISLSIYLYFSLRILKSQQLADVSLLRPINNLCKAFLGFQFIWLIFLIPYAVPTMRFKLLETVGWYGIYLPLTLLVYCIGAISSQMLTSSPISVKKPQSITPETIQHTLERLQQSMLVDKLYLNPELDLSMLVAHTKIAQKTISYVLNNYQNQSFNEFINAYRVAAIKEKIASNEFKQYTLHGIAAQCGFSSLATFQRSFKQQVGMSPSNYLKTLQT